VNQGVTGSMHSYFIIPLPPGTMQTSHSSSCDGSPTPPSTDCTTTIFIDTHFTPCYRVGACSASTFFTHYVGPAQGLLENEWKNASMIAVATWGTFAAQLSDEWRIGLNRALSDR